MKKDLESLRQQWLTQNQKLSDDKEKELAKLESDIFLRNQEAEDKLQADRDELKDEKLRISHSLQELIKRSIDLKQWEDRLEISQKDLTERDLLFNKNLDEFNILKESKDKDLEDIDNKLSAREKEIDRLEKNIAERHDALKDQEYEINKKEDSIRLTMQETEKQSTKLASLVDTYDKRLKTFAEKEKLLQIRDIQLADREAVAITHTRK